MLKPLVEIEYAGKDVTRELAPMLLAASYTDHDHGQSDQIEVQLENVDGRWQRGWRPKPGDRLKLTLGYVGGIRMDRWLAGTIDEIEYAGPPDMVTIRALGTPITEALRTPHTASYEHLTLRQIAERLATPHKLKVMGTGQGLDVVLARVTQQEETDLAFLQRLANQWGLIVTVKAARLTIQPPEEERKAVLTLTPSDLTRYTIQERITKQYAAAEVAYHEPSQGEAVHRATASGDAPKPDVLKLNMRVENQAQADAIAEAALARSQRDRLRLSLELPGEPRLLAGLSLALAGFGTLDATYYIETVTHRVTREQGYVTSVEARGVTR